MIGALLVMSPVLAKAVDDGVVRARDAARLTAYLGDYRGQWNTEQTVDVYDDISRYELKSPVLRLALDDARRLTVTFFMDAEAAAAGRPLDLLGFGCRSGVGDLLEIGLPKPPKRDGQDPYPVLEARFDFDWGGCPMRVYAVEDNDLEVTVSVDPGAGEHIVHAALLRRVRPDDRIYAERDGRTYEVEVRRGRSDPESLRPPPLEYCVRNADGEPVECFAREAELKRFIVPFPLGSLSAAWYTKRTPKIRIEKGTERLYHEAVFRRRVEAD